MFYICHIYSGHSSVFISLQLLYQQNCSKWAVFVETWRVVTERERGWPERHLCVENAKYPHRYTCMNVPTFKLNTIWEKYIKLEGIAPFKQHTSLCVLNSLHANHDFCPFQSYLLNFRSRFYAVKFEFIGSDGKVFVTNWPNRSNFQPHGICGPS